jgi:hypothetical protein
MAPIGYVTRKGKDKLWRIIGDEGIELVLEFSATFELRPNQEISYEGTYQKEGEDYALDWTRVVGNTFCIRDRAPHSIRNTRSRGGRGR